MFSEVQIGNSGTHLLIGMRFHNTILLGKYALMPTSDPCSITPIIAEIFCLSPKSVLDLGIGCGKYGMLCREYPDGWYERFRKDQWQVRIVGVEGFLDYRNPAWDFYDEIRIEDFSKGYESYTGFDLVLMLDSLEHIDKQGGLKLLATLRKNNKAVIVCVPESSHPQGAVCGNEFERHRATWTAKELSALGGRVFFTGKSFQATVSCSAALFEIGRAHV